jgi:hypothetical protein
MKFSRLSLHSIRSADPQGWLALAGLRPAGADLRLFAELKAAESNIDSALQLAVLRRRVAISCGDIFIK